jgi:hypothetical protein
MRIKESTPVLRYDIADEIILYFRESGRNCEVKYIPHMKCFVAMVSLRSNDPLLGSFQSGVLSRVPTEDVFFHEPNPDAGKIMGGVRQGPFRPLDLNQMGASGVRTWLEQRNVLSGRGEFKSLLEQHRAVDKKGREGVAKIKQETRSDVIDFGLEVRRVVEKIPYNRVGIDLKETG